MDEWAEVLGDGSPVPGWEAWNIQVSVGTMPDGSIVATGLRIEPRDDYDGSKRDQHLTLAKLRQFPIGFVTADARRHLHGASEKDVAKEAGRLRAAALGAQLEDNYRKQYQQRVSEVGEHQALLENVADFHRMFLATALPEEGGVRQAIADDFGISVWTVDRLLREAREQGLLEPYHGKQGKHGKTEEPTKRKRSKKS